MNDNRQSNVIRHNMYLKYTKSNLFSSENKDNVHIITPKITEKKYFSSIYMPQYNEKSAREQYMKQLWNKDIKEPKTASKPIKLNLQLNDNDIICRDMFSDCDVKEYKKRRSKSFFLPRSSYSINLSDKNTMSSRRRKIDHMSSDIFFTECNTPRKQSKEMYLTQLTATPKEKNKPPMSFRNKISNNNTPSHTLVQSKLPSHCDWRYTNTEPKLRRSETVGPKKTSFRKRHLCERDTISQLSEVRDSIASSGCRTNPTNVESVNYNLLMPTKPNSTTPTVFKFNSFFHEDKKKIMNPAKMIENYEIKVPKEFTKLNLREIKNYFLSEGLHIFNFEEKQNCVNNQEGKLTFKIRRSDIDKDYDSKISKIHQKVGKHQMVMKQVPFIAKLPISTISKRIEPDDCKSQSHRKTPTEDKVKIHLSRRSIQNSPSRTQKHFKAIQKTSFKSEKLQYDLKYKNKYTSKKA